MQKVKLVLFVLLCAIPLLVITSVETPDSQTAEINIGSGVSGGFTLTEDPWRGYLTAENDAVKVVWHYKIRQSEFGNRGGGNIYELYDKQTDPQMNRNLVAVVNDGTADTSPPMAGIGGLGATYLYEHGWNVAVGDNGGRAQLESVNHYIDAQGNAVFEARLVVQSAVGSHPNLYRVQKKWSVFPDGQIKLDISMTMLRSFQAAQIAYNFSFNRDYGWHDATSKRHFWSLASCANIGVHNQNNNDLAFNDISSVVDRDNPLMHNQSFTLHGQSSGVSASVKMDNGGEGFESGGLFGVGQALWGTTASPTSEYSNFSQRAYGHTVRFFAWWAGDPPQPDRYRYIQAGTSWSDTLWIEMQDSSQPSPPDLVGNPSSANLTATTATVQWTTDVASDSQVIYRQVGTESYSYAGDQEWSPYHSVDLYGLIPGVTYEYQVRSADAIGQTSAGGTFVTVGVEGVNMIPIVSWIGWASFNDFTARRLAVDFEATNTGLNPAVSAEVTDVVATSGVTGEIVDSQVGPVAPGGRAFFRIYYHIPYGLSAFKTVVYMHSRDDTGSDYYFPG